LAESKDDIDGCEFRAIDGMRGRGGGHHNFDACVRGGVNGSCSKGEGPPFLEPPVYTKSCQFQASSPLVREYVSVVRSGRG
jgi:hypothetical protein